MVPTLPSASQGLRRSFSFIEFGLGCVLRGYLLIGLTTARLPMNLPHDAVEGNTEAYFQLFEGIFTMWKVKDVAYHGFLQGSFC